MMTTAASPDRGSQPRWRRVLRRSTGALPVLVVLGVVIALAAALLPQVRDQLRVSFVRHDPAYVEMVLPDDARQAAQVACRSQASSLVLDFSLQARGRIGSKVHFTTRVLGPTGTQSVDSGSVALDGRGPVLLATSATVPAAGGWVVEIRLDGTSQLLSVACPAASP